MSRPSGQDGEEHQQHGDIADLQDSFSKQQEKISALKELVRKSEVAHGKSTSSAQEKVKNIAQRLTQLKSKAKTRHVTDATKTVEIPVDHEHVQQQQQSQMPVQQQLPAASVFSSTPQRTFDANASGSEKIMLLRQQMEQNRALMAQRASSKQHLEQLVTQLKENLNTTQQSLEDTTELGRSMGDLSILGQTPVSRGERHRSATDLLASQPAFSLERERIKFLENRCRLLEKQLDKERQGNSSSRDNSLQDTSAQSLKRAKELENKMAELEQALKEKEQELQEKQQQIEEHQNRELQLSQEIEQLRIARPEGEDSPQIENSADSNEIIETLRREIESHLERIGELENVNDILATSNEDLSSKCSKFEEILKEKDEELLKVNASLESIREELQKAEEKSVGLQTELDNLVKKPSPLPASPQPSNTDAQVTAEMAKQIQELQDELLRLRTVNAELQCAIEEKDQLEISDASIAEKIASLESTIESQRQDLHARLEANKHLEEKLMEKTIEADVANANFKVLEEKLQGSTKSKPVFSASESDSAATVELQAEIQELKQKLDDSNKAMIKLKLKAKQTEKQMEKLKKSSDLHGEVVRLEKLIEELQQKVTELEDEKGQWQLSLVDEDESAHWKESKPEDDRIIELEGKCEQQRQTISRLETELEEKDEEAASVSRQLEELRQRVEQQHDDERVKSEMSGIQLEEQLELQQKAMAELRERLQNTETELDEHKKEIAELKQQKQELDKKLEHYVAENMDLLDKMSKVSKSSSSAESIEIVERLTNQERAEMDELTKRLDNVNLAEVPEPVSPSVNELTQTEMGPELSESLVKLREESSELMKKIELFTTERREVLEKMENLTAENNSLLKRYEEVLQQKEQLEAKGVLAEGAKLKLELKLQELTKEKELLALQVAESSAQKSQLSQELTSMQKSSEVVAALDCAEGASLFDKCEKSLAKLNSELESYRKADRNAKINASKKLAKEAKNAYTQLSELLIKVKEASSAVETVTVVETVVAVTAPNGKALAEYEQLTMQNRELKARIEDLMRELHSMREEMADMEVPAKREPLSVPALTADPETAIVEAEKLKEALQKVSEYEEQVQRLEDVVASLRDELQESDEQKSERSQEVTRLSEEIASLKKLSSEFDQTMSDSKLSYEQQLEKLTHLRLQLEGKCETYEGEMEILQTLVAEQKQQLIEAYKENEHEMNLKLLALQERDQQIAELKSELQEMRQSSQNQGSEASETLQRECDKLRESLKINKALVAEQLNELANKQETIDTLNQQLIDLYKTMEQNANAVIEKEDEITYLQELLDSNKADMERLQKVNNQQKEVVDKLLIELHTHKANTEQLPQLELDLKNLTTVKTDLEAANEDLQKRNKEQLEKLKKYAANLKKRTSHCLELEAKLKNFEKQDSQESASKETEASLNEVTEKLHESERKVNELEEALHLKTSEWLESNERIESLEASIEAMRREFDEKRQEVVQLQNALAASQEAPQSDWGTFDEKSPLDEVMEANAKILQLEADLKLAEESRSKSEAKLQELENLLDSTETELGDLQGELQQLKEQAHEREQALKDLTVEIASKKEEIENLSKQLAAVQANNANTPEKDQRISELTEELKTKSLKFEKSKAVIKERNNQIHRLQAQLKDLQDKLSQQPEEVPEIVAAVTQTPLGATVQPTGVPKEEYDSLKAAYDKLNEQFETEKSNFLATISRLETLHDGIQAKLQEDMSYIETLEQENAKFKEKICKLEECVGTFEERRASMERSVNLLDAQMQTRANEYVTKEDELVYRLNMLADHDDLIGQRLLATQEEKEEMQERHDNVLRDFHELQTKHSQLAKEFENYKEDVVSSLEQETVTLRQQLSANEKDWQHQRSVYDAKLAAKTTELDELECELSEQLEKMNAEKRTLTESLEMSQDECSELKDEIVRLRENVNTLEQAKHELDREATWLRMQHENSQQDQYDLQELRMQTMQDKTEIDNLRAQIETLAANHEIELQALRTQISELDSLRMQVGQNQTDDQVFIETENKRLTDLLAEKDALIENYQRQLVSGANAVQQPPQQSSQAVDFFAATFGLPPANTNNISTTNENHENLERELAEKTEMNAALQRDVSRLQGELQSVLEGNAEMQRQVAEKNRELENLRAMAAPAQNVNDVVLPAPPMFFSNDQVTHSPFDDIVQARVNEAPLEAVIPPPLVAAAALHGNVPDDLGGDQPTIEDLQRNVSDLEKHAQDLENKLAARNQRESDFEERLLELQTKLQDAESCLREREQQVQSLEARLWQMEESQAADEQSLQVTHKNWEESQMHLSRVEGELKLRTERLAQVEAELLAASNWQGNVPDSSQDNKVAELEKAVGELKAMLCDKEKLVDELQLAVRRNGQQQQSANVLDSQIIEEPILEQFKPTLDMFFGAPSTDDFGGFVLPTVQDEPVQEEIIVPKKAYVCQPEDEVAAQTAAVASAFNVTESWGDEGGWGEIDAEAESQHFATKMAASSQGAQPSLVSRSQQLEIQLEEQQEKLKELQKNLDQSEQQKQELQVKSSKMMKKLKEYKTKIEELQSAAQTTGFKKSTSVDSSNMFDDLDAAIQEELKTQIKKLEEKLSEQLKLQETFGVEKEKLLKRIDVLTAGNERMSEMKERQDMEVHMYQSRIKELQSKLESLDDWGADGGGSIGGPRQSQQVEESGPSMEERSSVAPVEAKQDDGDAQAKLAELQAENQELQALVEEEKANVRRAEELVRNLQNQITACNNSTATLESTEKAKYNDLLYQYQNLEVQRTDLQEANTKLSHQLQEAEQKIQESEKRLQQSEQKLQDSEKRLQECEQKLQDSEKKLLNLQQLQGSVEQLERLQQQVEASETYCGTLQAELLLLRTQLSELTQAQQETQQLAENFQRVAAENEYLKTQLQQNQLQQPAASTGHSDELAALLQERDAEIVHLKQRIEDLMREDQTEKLVLEILTKNQEIAMLKLSVKNLEDDKHELEHNLSLQITKEMQAKQTDVQPANEAQLEEMAQKIGKLEAANQELESEKKSMEEELNVLNNHVMSSLEMEDKMKTIVLELDMKNIEIAELRKSLEAMVNNPVAQMAQQAAPPAVEATPPPVDMAALNAQWEAVVEQKCGEVAEMWRAHLEVRERDFKAAEARLREEILALKHVLDSNAIPYDSVLAASSAASTTASEATTDSGSQSSSNVPSNDGTPMRTRMVIGENETAATDDMIEKMQAALESQEMEIVSLKEQLAIRSAEYARLAAKYDPFQLQSGGSPSPVKRTPTGENASTVPKSELDLALYMLHQRNMRCEEMTHEIVSLLEERDTLQLKLSNTLRQVEAIKTHHTLAGDASSSSTEALASGELGAPSIPDDSSDELSQKLSQLQTVNHSKDKMIVEEREQRIRQMARLQQDVAKIPPAAVSELVGADLSHSNQSPSSVLLNWLWGNQTNPGNEPPQ